MAALYFPGGGGTKGKYGGRGLPQSCSNPDTVLDKDRSFRFLVQDKKYHGIIICSKTLLLITLVDPAANRQSSHSLKRFRSKRRHVQDAK